MTTDTQSRYLSFGDFRLDLQSGELRKNGREVRLQPQPAKLLVLLAGRPGEVVTRGEIQKTLWGEDTFVDFEHGINFSIKQIREALGDSAEKPRYIETVPRIGYRFIAGAASTKPEERTSDDLAQTDLERFSSRVWKNRAIWLAVPFTIVVLALAVSVLRSIGPTADVRQPRFQLTLPRGVSLAFESYSTLAISPDGTRVAFVGCGDACGLYLRERSEIDAQLLQGTEGATSPFFSPDGRWIGFWQQSQLKKIDLEHNSVVTLAEAPSLRGASWGDEGAILFATGNSGLSRVFADGGNVELVTKLEPGEIDHRWPQILPGEDAVVFEALVAIGLGSYGHDVVVMNLKSGTRRKLVERAGYPQYALSGHLLFGRDGMVYAGPLDLERLALVRPPVPVLEGVAMWSTPGLFTNGSGVVAYGIARDGTLLFSPHEDGLPKRTLVMLGRTGTRETVSPSQRAYFSPRFSPDGHRIAVSVQTDAAAMGTFVLDVRSGAWTQVNLDDETSTKRSLVAGWLPDGRRLIVGVEEETLLVPIDRSEQHRTFPISISAVGSMGSSVAPGGGSFLFAKQSRPGDFDVWRVALTGDYDAEPWLATPSEESCPQFSPDGIWVVYFSNDSGQGEVYVRQYAGSTERYQVSTKGGDYPRWSRDGREIFFHNSGSLWSVAVRTSPTFSAQAPQKLFDLPEDIRGEFYDVSPDGQTVLMVQMDPLELRPLDLVVVPNWGEEMKARLAAAK